MKLNKLFLGLLGLTAMVMSSCSDNDDYQWATASGEQVYFSNELPASYEISFDASSFTIPVSRVNTSSSITVPVSIESDGNFFSAPSSVSFTAGESTANLTISYDPDSLVYDAYKNAKLTIGKEYSTPYGNDTYSFKAGVASPYKSLGKGVYSDNYYFGKSVSVTIMQNQEQKNTYRVMDPYKSITGGGDAYIEITILQPGNKVGDVEITQTGLVRFASCNTGYHHPDYDADIWIHHPSRFNSLQNESAWLKNRIIGYKEDGTPGQIALAPYYYMDGVGGWNATGEDAAIVITFPGYNPKDMSAEMNYLGVLTDPSGVASAAVNLTFGSDVQDARAIVVGADADPDAVSDAIAAGEIEAIPVTSGTNYVPIGDGLTGKLMVVVVVLDEGAVKGIVTNGFEYYGGGKNPWESLGVGLMIDNLFITMYSPDGENYYEPQAIEVEIQQNTDEPGLLRLVDPYQKYAETLGASYETTSLEVNATDPEAVYIELQSTGVDDGDGMTYVGSYGGYMLQKNDVATLKENGYLGTLVDGVITLPSFPVKDDDGNLQFTFQGIFAQGSSAWRTGIDTEFKLYMPDAVPAEARKAADNKKKAYNFARRMFGKKTSWGELRKARNRAIMSRDQIAY